MNPNIIIRHLLNNISDLKQIFTDYLKVTFDKSGVDDLAIRVKLTGCADMRLLYDVNSSVIDIRRRATNLFINVNKVGSPNRIKELAEMIGFFGSKSTKMVTSWLSDHNEKEWPIILYDDLIQLVKDVNELETISVSILTD